MEPVGNANEDELADPEADDDASVDRRSRACAISPMAMLTFSIRERATLKTKDTHSLKTRDELCSHLEELFG